MLTKTQQDDLAQGMVKGDTFAGGPNDATITVRKRAYEPVARACVYCRRQKLQSVWRYCPNCGAYLHD